ncbi:MAG: DNA repair exonuclease [Pyrinomonadaceae bacterium]|nr:DNA repair exonuclease [Pyrinomonadaceae bacterium]MCX7640108.1 DNA repair exonuclease [Pyrinomonadaceae bacterium]MDW8303304.1 DNA repair exonuclease [Acidobacteriota bacterium]
MKFLHISDVHLGRSLYGDPNLERDYYRAFKDVVEKYALGEKVDFVLIVGDLLHETKARPEHINQAHAIFHALKNAQIPVVLVEGNHDKRAQDYKISWLEYLSRVGQGFIYFLMPKVEQGDSRQWIYEAWSEETFQGGYVDIKQARIFGLNFLGRSLNSEFPLILEALKKARREDGFNILMIHGEIQGQEKGSYEGLSQDNLRRLKEVIDYLALGHIHKKYELDDWIYNPGALSPTSIDEHKEERGAFLIEVNEQNQIVSKRHIKNYYQRKFERIELAADSLSTPNEFYDQVEKLFRNLDYKDTVVEISITGFLRFPWSSLDTKLIVSQVKKLTNAYHIRLTNRTISEKNRIDAESVGERSSKELEKRIIRSFVMQDSRFKQSQDLVERTIEIIIGSKEMVINEEPPEKIFTFIKSRIAAR